MQCRAFKTLFLVRLYVLHSYIIPLNTSYKVVEAQDLCVEVYGVIYMGFVGLLGRGAGGGGE